MRLIIKKVVLESFHLIASSLVNCIIAIKIMVKNEICFYFFKLIPVLDAGLYTVKVNVLSPSALRPINCFFLVYLDSFGSLSTQCFSFFSTSQAGTTKNRNYIQMELITIATHETVSIV